MAGPPIHDGDRTETQEWIDSLQAVAQTAGRERAMFLLGRLIEWGQRNQIVASCTANTAYVNTIPAEPAIPQVVFFSSVNPCCDRRLRSRR